MPRAHRSACFLKKYFSRWIISNVARLHAELNYHYFHLLRAFCVFPYSYTGCNTKYHRPSEIQITDLLLDSLSHFSKWTCCQSWLYQLHCFIMSVKFYGPCQICRPSLFENSPREGSLLILDGTRPLHLWTLVIWIGRHDVFHFPSVRVIWIWILANRPKLCLAFS